MMKEQTIRMLLLAGIIILSAFIVTFFVKEFILERGEGAYVEGFQTIGSGATASPAPPLQKMMMVLLGPGSGANAADGDVFISNIGTSFTSPKWEVYPAGSSGVSKIRIDNGADYLNIKKVRIFDAAGTNINSKVTVTAKSNGFSTTGAALLTNQDTGSSFNYHSDNWVDEFLEFTISPATQISRIEIDNRNKDTGANEDLRLATYTLRVLNEAGTEFYRKRLTGDLKQIYTIPANNRYTPMASITGSEGRLYATNSASAIFATKPYTKLSEGVWSSALYGQLKQVSRDGRSVCGVNIANHIYCATTNIEFAPNWTRIAGEAFWISVSNGRAACVGTDYQVYYTRNYYEGNGNSVVWANIQSNIGKRVVKQVVLDDTRIGAIDAEGNIFMADLRETGVGNDGGLTNAPRWFQVGGKRARHLEMRLGRVLIIAEEDGKVYYSDDYRFGTAWTPVPLPTDMREVFMTTPDTFNRVAARNACTTLDTALATEAQLSGAWKAGANWCKCASTTDKGRQFPNNEDTSGSCQGPTPGVKLCPVAVGETGAATCYGKKPAEGTGNVAKFNSKFWNAPPLAIEFVQYSTVPDYCGQEGRTGVYKGARFRYYARRECDLLGRNIKNTDLQLKKGEDEIRTTSYNAGNAECRIINSKTGNFIESASSKTCVNVQDRPDQTQTQIWDDGSTGNCVFNAGEYWKKYKDKDAKVDAANVLRLQKEKDAIENLDIGALYEHWIETGAKALYSPCGDINPSCHWNPDAYYTMNPTAKKDTSTRDPFTHYTTKGVQQGLKFCNSAGFFPLLDSLLKSTQAATIVKPTGDLATNCTPQDVVTGAPIFSKNEAFLVAPEGGVKADEALNTCQKLGIDIRLATVVELREAQLNGGEWCTPGWIQVMQYERYDYTNEERASINAGKSEQAVCEVGGRVFSKGDEKKAPGCGTIAWCCRPTGAVATASVPYFPVATLNSGCADRPGVYRVSAAQDKAAVVCYGPKPAPDANTVTRPFNVNKYSMYGGQSTGKVIKQWSCSNRAFAETLFAGPGPSDQAYLGTNDTVCFTDNAASKKYFCRSAQEYRNGEDYSIALSRNYDLTCNRMTQALADLSGTITTINNIKGGLENGRNTIAAAAATLDGVFTKLGCGGLSADDPLQPTCKVININKTNLLNYANKANTETDKPDTYSVQYVYDQVTSPMEAATSSRAAILDTIQKFRCGLDVAKGAQAVAAVR